MPGPHAWGSGDVLLSADLNKFSEGFWGSYSGTTDGSNNVIITHGAGFTPSFVFIQPVGPSGGANQGFPCVTAVGATTFTLRYDNTAGSMASVAVSGYFLCLP